MLGSEWVGNTTRSKDLNQNDRTVNLISKTHPDTQGNKEHLISTTTDKIHVELTRDVQLNALVNVEDLNHGGVNERILQLTSEALFIIGSCSKGNANLENRSSANSANVGATDLRLYYVG